ncbi:protein D3 isoform X2 [Bemisia tabaci]|uniref:protein D3 isoform X2 n=1 Tax=Bemisia tabaci TaxID=7038 RepID=UPI003B288744
MGDSRNGPIPKSLRLFCAVISLLTMGYCARFWRLPTQVEMNHKMNYFKIWPDVVAKKANLSFIRVQFRQTVTVVLGNKVHVKALGDKPHSITWKADNNTLHTLLLVDPDWPIKEPRTVNEFPHWMVGNIPGNNVEKGETIFDYVGYRATVVDKEPHRYTFVAYRQPGEEPIKFDEPRLNDTQILEREKLSNFSAKNIAKKYGLRNAGINFFLVSHKRPYVNDDYLIDIEYWDD